MTKHIYQNLNLTWADSHEAIIYISRHMPEVLARFRNHGNPVVRRAAEVMIYIHGMPDQDTARQHQSVEDCMYYMPIAQIEECLDIYALRPTVPTPWRNLDEVQK